MSDDAGGARTAVCGPHGLRYDPTISAGCVVCMRAGGRTDEPKNVSRRGIVIGGASVVGAAAAAVAGYAVWSRWPSVGGAMAGEKIRYDARSGTGHEGALFLPAPSATPPPLLLLLDPGGAALGIVNRYAPAAARNGWMLASSFHVRNGTSDENDIDEISSLRDSLAGRGFDEARVYIGGMSGAATTGYQFAIEWSNKFRGAISECGQMAGWRKVRGTAKGSLRSSFYLFTCSGDFNRDATRTLYAEMTKTGYRAKLVERETGGHESMRPEEIDDALVWLGAAG